MRRLRRGPTAGSLIAFVTEADAAKRILDNLGMDSHAPPRARTWAPEDEGAFADSEPGYAPGDPVDDH